MAARLPLCHGRADAPVPWPRGCPCVMAARLPLCPGRAAAPVSWPRLSRPSTASCLTGRRGWPPFGGH